MVIGNNNAKCLQYGLCVYMIKKGWQDTNSYHPFPQYISSKK